jgi:argininosuccinate lyase
VPFRKAHGIAGKAVRYCLDKGKGLEDLNVSEWKALAPEVGPSVQRTLRLEQVVEARNVPGGTARRQVRKQIRQARGEVEKRRNRLDKDRTKSGLLSL